MTSDQKFDVPEPPTGLKGGFLTDYWFLEEPLPRIKGWELVWYYLNRGVQTILALPTSNVITIITIAVSLFMLAGFLLLVQNVDRMISSAGGTFYVTAYLKDVASPNEVNEVVQELKANSRVRSVEYVSKDKAMQNFRRDLGSQQEFLSGLDNENPLPASLDVVLHADELGSNSVNRILEFLRGKRVVEEVVFGNDWINKVQGVLRLFRFLGSATLFIALVIIISLIANTIKLVIYSRRDEISIMRLVGASDWFIRIPFVLGGLLQGLIGSVIGLLLLKFGFYLFNVQIRNTAFLGVAIPEISFLSFLSISGIILLGLLVGALGSFFSLGRFMHT